MEIIWVTCKANANVWGKLELRGSLSQHAAFCVRHDIFVMGQR